MISCTLSSTVSRAKNEKVYHSRFLGHRRVLARPLSYGRCSGLSYTSPKSPELCRSAGGATTTTGTRATSTVTRATSAATHYYCSTSAATVAAAPSAAAPSAARSYDWGSRDRRHLVVAAVRPRRDIWHTVDSATVQEKLTPRFVVACGCRPHFVPMTVVTGPVARPLEKIFGSDRDHRFREIRRARSWPRY
jgi:hypothetical protein